MVLIKEGRTSRGGGRKGGRGAPWSRPTSTRRGSQGQSQVCQVETCASSCWWGTRQAQGSRDRRTEPWTTTGWSANADIRGVLAQEEGPYCRQAGVLLGPMEAHMG